MILPGDRANDFTETYYKDALLVCTILYIICMHLCAKKVSHNILYCKCDKPIAKLAIGIDTLC